MTRFRCIADACEDSCCVGWQVPVDRISYIRQRRMVDRGHEGGVYARAVIVNERAKGDGDYAHVALRSNGSCHFLDEERLCSLQRHGGIDALGNACANYPRVISRIGDRVEIAGSLSCPEVARLCLLADDAMDVGPFDPALIPRPYSGQTLSSPSDDPYLAGFDDIRSAAIRILADRRVPFRDRALSLVRLGQEVPPSPRRARRSDTEEVRAAGETRDVSASAPVVLLLLNLLQSRAAVSTGRRFDALVARVLSTYGVKANVALVHDGMAMRAYGSRCARLETLFGHELDRVFSNYAMNFWITRWYTDYPSVAAYVQGLLLRVALLRVLLVGHPSLNDVLEQGKPDASGRQEVERAAVEVVQCFTKDIEHGLELVDEIGLGIAPHEQDLVDQSVALAGL